MADIISRLLDESEKAQRKGHLVLGEVCRDASDHIGLLEHEIDRLRAALRGLLADTQHAEHDCGDADCPVALARAALGQNGREQMSEREFEKLRTTEAERQAAAWRRA